jgi:predicted dehydrogenase
MPTGRQELLPTRWTLIQRLKRWDDQEGWREFFDTYWKLIYSAALKSGLTAVEAQEVVQETVISVSRNIGDLQPTPEAGSFNLIIEKPLALNWQDCLAIQKAVQDAGVKTCVCFECRFSSQFLTIKAVIDRGLLGKIHYGEVDYYHGIGPWYGQFRWNTRRDAGGSSLLSAGCHALDALLLCMGEDVETVSAYSTHSLHRDFAKYEYPTTSVTILKFKDGRVGKCASVIDCLQPYYFHVHLVGSEGSLLDNKFHSTQLGGLNKGKWSEMSMKLLDSGDVSDHPYQTQFEAFFNALNVGHDMPLTSLAHARNHLRRRRLGGPTRAQAALALPIAH